MTATTAAAGARDDAGATAADLDAGRADVRPALRRLGGAGAFGAAGEDPADALVAGVRMVREVATGSLAAAFSTWSQRMVVEYLRCCPLPRPMAGLVDALRTAEVTGATALAPAIGDLAGGAPLPVVAERNGSGWRLSGTIGWASNLFDDALVVAPARTPEEGRLVVAFRLTAPGVTPTPRYDLFRLNGTGTGGLHLDGVAVGPEQVLSEDLPGFMASCRPTMLLLQTALAVGLGDASLAQTRAALTGAATVLRADHEEVAGRRDGVGVRMEELAASQVGAGPAELARLRLDAMRVAADAVRLESAVSGGSGYRADSDTARRVREAAFLPVQAPTEVQLRLAAEAS
jgi:alkylation response protein AidB-like acyl-CoA dehydrogenase